MIEFLISLILKLAVLITCLSALFWAANWFRLYTTCDKVVRSVEITGVVDTTTYDLVKQLAGDNLTVDTKIEASSWYDTSKTEIQLRNTFTITLTSYYKVPIITPLSGGNTVYLSIPIKVHETGMSEKYWR